MAIFLSQFYWNFISWPLFISLINTCIVWVSSIVVRALPYCAKDHGSGPTSNLWLDTRSLSTQQQMGTRWKHWGDKGGEERNWTSYLKKLMA